MNMNDMELVLKKKDEEIAYLKKLLEKFHPKIEQHPSINNKIAEIPIIPVTPISQDIPIILHKIKPKVTYELMPKKDTYVITCCILMSGGLNNFKKTMDSIMSGISDINLVTHWICVDAYSEENDLTTIHDSYPNMHILSLEGHPITRQQMFYCALKEINNKFSDTECLLLLGDGIKFIKKGNFIGDALSLFNQENTCFVTLNKIMQDYECKYEEFNNGLNNSLWPCFSLRPTLFDFKILDKISKLYEMYTNKYFEYHLVNNLTNYKFSYLNNINYQIDLLNNFYKFKLPYFKINIISTKYSNNNEFMKFFDANGINTRIHELKQIKKLDNKLLNLFKNNTFGYRLDIISHIMTHINLFDYDCEYTNNDINIFIEDHVIIPKNFMKILYDLIDSFEDDILFLGENMSGYIIKKTCMSNLVKLIENSNIVTNLSDFICSQENINIGQVDILKTNIDTPYDEEINQLENYTFFSLLDSHGNDIQYVGKKSLNELKTIADNDPTCVAFNTLGWMKHSISDVLNFKPLDTHRDVNVGMYVKNSNVDFDNLLNYKINMLTQNKNKNIYNSNLTFTITTCKRWKLFESTMISLLTKCKDIEIVDRWLCVDDNSSEEDRLLMQQKFPFLILFLKILITRVMLKV